MAHESSIASVAEKSKVEKILGIGLIIALVGFFLLMISQELDTLFTDILSDLGNFPGLKQVLSLLGTIADAITKIITGIFSWFKPAASGS